MVLHGLWPHGYCGLALAFSPALLSWIHNSCTLSPSCKSHFVFETCILCFPGHLPSSPLPGSLRTWEVAIQSLSFQVRAGFKSQLRLYELCNLGEVVHFFKPFFVFLFIKKNQLDCPINDFLKILKMRLLKNIKLFHLTDRQ